MVLGITCVAPVLLAIAVAIDAGVSAHKPDYAAELKAGWVYIIITGIVHAVYIILLSHSYKIGDLTIVYPVARGSSVAFVAIFSRMIIPHYQVSALGYIGIAIVILGMGITAVKGREIRCTRCRRSDKLSSVPMMKLEEETQSVVPIVANEEGRKAQMTQHEMLVAVGFALAVGVCTAVRNFAFSHKFHVGVFNQFQF